MEEIILKSTYQQSLVGPQFLQDAEAFEFWELGNVELIVVKQDVDDSVAIRTVEAIEVHRGKVHSHQCVDATRVVGLQEIAMGRNQQREGGCSQVEDAAVDIVVEVRIETQEAAHPHQEGKVKVGIALFCYIEPLHSVDQIGE